MFDVLSIIFGFLFGKMRVLHLVPPLLNFLVNHPMVTPKDLDSVRVVMNSAAPVPLHVAEAFRKKAPNPFFLQESKKFLNLCFLLL